MPHPPDRSDRPGCPDRPPRLRAPIGWAALITAAALWCASPCAAQAPPPADAPASAPAAAPAPTPAQALTWTASAEVSSHSPERARDDLLAALTALGAYVQSSHDLSLDLRVPADAFPQAMHLLRYRADVTHHQTQSQDVALELSNLRARLKVLTDSRDRLRHMLSLSSTVSDTLLIERDLNQVTQEVESIQGQLRSLDHRLRLVPLHLSISRRAHDRPRLQRNNPFTWVSGYGPRSLLQEGH